MQDILTLDFESRSIVNLKTKGLDNYMRHPSTQPLLLSHALNSGKVKLAQFHEGPLPKELIQAIKSPDVIKSAWSVTFERQMFLRKFDINVPLDQWCDPSVYCKHLSLPGSLEQAGLILGLPPEFQKKESGKKLIKTFCEPVSLGGVETLFGITEPYFRDWNSNPREWEEFCEYCKADTESERYILNLLKTSFPLPDVEQQGWILDQKINERGMPTNVGFARKAFEMAEAEKEVIQKKMISLTGLENPRSNQQMLEWVKKEGYPFDSMGKNIVTMALAGKEISKEGREVLELRKEANKTSYKKLETLLEIVSEFDDQLRYQFNYLGAARTGRWSGRDVQLQNLPSPVTTDLGKYLDNAIALVEAGDFEGIRKKFGSIINCVTTIIRSCFQAPDGYILDVCDLNSIENRVLGWLAGCSAILEVFDQGLDAYLAFAARMYGIPYESLIKVENGKHVAKDAAAKAKRTVAKPAVLGCGYGLGPGVERLPDGTYVAIIKVDAYGNRVKTGLLGYAENMGVILTPEQAFHAHKAFRDAYPEVPKLWRAMDDAVKEVLKKGGKVWVGREDGKPGVCFDKKIRKNGKYVLRMLLPSGRYLHYMNARLEEHQRTDHKTGELIFEIVNGVRVPKMDSKIFYDGIGHGVGATSKKMIWASVYTYGGKLVENAVQAIARDLLLHAMQLFEKWGGILVAHIHDELVALRENVPWVVGLDQLRQAMETTPDWAPFLPLKAEGWSGVCYRKG